MSAKRGKMTPMYKQYKKLKDAYPDALLFYRLGDFYELFEDDAETGSRELGLTLTKRRFSKGMHLPMAGVPHRYVNSYIGRLIKKGHMVAVADQLEDARQAKGLVKRGIVRVVTSGTVMDQPLLNDYVDNFLMALAPDGDKTGMAFVDLSTGEFNCTDLDQADLSEELARICPSEVILPPVFHNDQAFCQSLTQLGVSRLSPLEQNLFELDYANTVLKDHFQVASLEAFSQNPAALRAAGAVLTYLKTNQLSELTHITELSTYQLSQHMALDVITRRNLELTQTLRDQNTEGTLLAVLDKTKTRMGARLLRRSLTHPLCHLPEIEARLDAVEIFVNDAFLRQDLQEALHGMYDLERLAGRIGYGNANGRDLVNLKATLVRIPTIKQHLARANQTEAETITLLNRIQAQLNPLIEIVTTIDQGLVDEPPILLTEGGLIKSDFHPKLDSLRQTAQENRQWLTDYEAAERERTGIKNLRIKYNQVFGFFIEVTRSNLNLVPDDYQRRATISTGERFNTPELKARETAIIAAEDAAHDLEYDLFLQIRQQVAEHLPGIRQTAQALAQLDMLTSFATVAALHNYVRPTLSYEPNLALREARHPVVEQVLASNEPFVANDCNLNDDERLIVLTGPNMSGKSVYLRQIALAVLMAQIGSFVAASEAHIGLTDRIFARAGASDDISQGRSTFLVEMSETAHILHHATERSLVILDEVGRGTSTYDGLSLAWAVAEDIHQTLNARCLFATHFHELTKLGEKFEGAANYSLAVHEKDGDVIFLRRLIAGGADRSYGIHVARLAGLPPRVLDKATAILESLEQQPELTNGNGNLPLNSDQHTDPSPLTLAEQPASYNTTPKPNTGPIQAADDSQFWEILGNLYRLDIANLTPVEALLKLNQWQQQLKQKS